MTLTKELITSSSNTDLTDSISLPKIPQPVWQLLWDSEAIKWKFTSILQVAYYIRSEDRKDKNHPPFRGRAYSAWYTYTYNKIYQKIGAGHQVRIWDTPTRSTQPSTCIRRSRWSSIFITCKEITNNQGDVIENEVEVQVKKSVHINTAIKQ